MISRIREGLERGMKFYFNELDFSGRFELEKEKSVYFERYEF